MKRTAKIFLLPLLLCLAVGSGLLSACSNTQEAADANAHHQNKYEAIDTNGAEQNVAQPSGDIITEAEAQNAALTHAKLSADQVASIYSKLEWDDARQVYDVEFYASDYREYDYTIDAHTGTVLSFDYDAEGYVVPQTGTESRIWEDRARSIALEKVPGSTAQDVRKLKLDFDDGRWKYEVEIIYDYMEHDFEIDAATGNILSWDGESVFD